VLRRGARIELVKSELEEKGGLYAEERRPSQRLKKILLSWGRANSAPGKKLRERTEGKEERGWRD